MKLVIKYTSAQAIRLLSYCFSSSAAQKILRAASLLIGCLRGMGSGSSHHLSGQTEYLRRLPKNAVVFDVGANIGQFAEIALKNCQHVQLHSFEPSSTAFDLLERNIASSAVRLNRCGLGDKEGEMILHAPAPGSELGSFSRRRLDHFGMVVGHSEKVQITTVDAYCKRNNIVKIDLLKVDIEGHEMTVFNGARAMLTTGKIREILFEFGGANIDSRIFFQDFYYYFKGFNAKSIGRLTPSGWEVTLYEYTEDLEYFRTSNYVVRF